MPILANAKKALRVSQRKAVVNRRIKSRTKSAIDAFTANPSAELLSEAYTAIDKSVKRNLFHINRGSRMKSKLSLIAKTAGVKLGKTTKATKKTVAKKATKTTKKAKKATAAKK